MVEGIVKRVTGPVVDVQFPKGKMPEIAEWKSINQSEQNTNV